MLTTRRSVWDRFWPKVDFSASCWTWTGAIDGCGYGNFGFETTPKVKNMKAHRAAWTLLVGEIGDGLQLDHLCLNKACVNPDHLQPVTQQENMRRAFFGPGVASGAYRPQPRREFCKKGLHRMDGENVMLQRRTPAERERGLTERRVCRPCYVERYKRRNQAEKEQRGAEKEARKNSADSDQLVRDWSRGAAASPATA